MAEEPVPRESGLGGTDIAAIVGASPYKTRFDVWAEKRGLAEPFIATPRMKIGLAQQPTIVQLFEEETGLAVEWFDRTIRHAKIPYVIGTPDGFLSKKESGFEAKTAGLDQAWRWGEEQDAIPEEYLIQCQWYMLVTGRPEWYMAALIGGDRFRVHKLERDEELQATLLEEAEKFWTTHIIKGVQPDLDGGRAARALIRRMYPHASKEVREATGAELEAMREYARIQKELKYLKGQKETLQVRLEASIGSGYGLTGEGLRAVWYETKESSYMVTRHAGRTFKLTDKRRSDDDDEAN